ncbi:GNAT family N-acetyltransferase [Paenibacillus sp. GCM10012303]|uniref:GNAT family N-acetyltransferase n=1 Tax=Paenibacillus sp. GCM10012303 TaxID=3317340 RepID=UPI00360F55D4
MRLDAADPEDELFLYELFAEPRRRELSGSGCQTATVESLLHMQYRAREATYLAVYPDSAFSVVREHGRPVGAVRVNIGPSEITLIDIAVQSEERNRGLGSEVIFRLLEEAQADRKPVLLRVDNGNEAAQRLYKRHGFACLKAGEVYTEMRWEPEQAVDQSPESVKKEVKGTVESTLDQYKSAAGTVFRVGGVDPALELKLLEVEDRGRSSGYESFTLLFKGPLQPFIQQQTLVLHHPDLEASAVFVVPHGRDPDGYRYEAAFNRLIRD